MNAPVAFERWPSWLPHHVVAGAALLAVYAATLAPDVTFWDAGEMIAAAHSLGIPHPPGTPLFVLLLNAWARLFPFLPYAVATNLFSAVATAAAATLTGGLIARSAAPAVGPRSAALLGAAATLCAGSMSTAWASATETEVYATSLLLSILGLWCADRAGRQGSDGWRLLVAYVFGLAASLHLSALVAAPAAVYLAASRDGAKVDVASALELAAAALSAMALGTLSRALMGASVVTLFAAAIRRRSLTSMRFPLVALLGATAILFMLVRARHDPAINQGYATTLGGLADAIARKQYEQVPLWPRRAPLWLQVGNWFEFADWQFALSLGPTVVPTIARTLTTIVFAAAALFGAGEMRRDAPRIWRATMLLAVFGTLGVVLYLNLRATPSFGWGILPDDARHEARERDYFFVLGFWAWGIWAGYGAVQLMARWRRPAAIGVLVAALPLALNWAAVTRRGQPEASAPRVLAEMLLAPLPRDAVLFVAGDNDSYPLWYAKEVLGLRPDVTTITIPLLGARWYGEELARRSGLIRPGTGGSSAAIAKGIAAEAIHRRRPVAAALTVDDAIRSRLHSCWTVIGVVAIAVLSPSGQNNCLPTEATVSLGATPGILVDTARVVATAVEVDRWLNGRYPRPAIDPVSETFVDVLACPKRIAAAALSRAKTGAVISLDSLCNSR